MLNPKKYKVILDEVANELNISKEQLDDMVSFYWMALRKQLEMLEEPNIFVQGFGTFYVKPKSLKSEILKNELNLKVINSKSYKRYPYFKYVQEQYNLLLVLSEKLNNEQLRQKSKIIERYGKHTRNLEK